LKPNALLAAFAITIIACLEGVALYRGLDGAMLAAIVAVIAGLAGYIMPAREK